MKRKNDFLFCCTHMHLNTSVAKKKNMNLPIGNDFFTLNKKRRHKLHKFAIKIIQKNNNKFLPLKDGLNYFIFQKVEKDFFVQKNKFPLINPNLLEKSLIKNKNNIFKLTFLIRSWCSS